MSDINTVRAPNSSGPGGQEPHPRLLLHWSQNKTTPETLAAGPPVVLVVTLPSQPDESSFHVIYSSDLQQGVVTFAPGGYLAKSRAIFDHQAGEGKDATSIRGQTPEMLVNILACTGQPHCKERSSQQGQS